MEFQKVGITSDHAGKELKQLICKALQDLGLDLLDFGVAADSQTAVDYPDFAAKAAAAVSKGELEGAIAICGTGIGMAITANKFPGVRAASAWDEYSCRMGREHNNSNVLCIGSRTHSPESALRLVKLWLATPFAGERHQLRLAKISALEHKCLPSP